MAVWLDVQDTDVYKAWCSIGTTKGFTSHTQIAAFLIQIYHASKDGGNSLDKHCSHCKQPLSLLCVHCRLPQQQPQQQQQQRQPQQSHSLEQVSDLSGIAPPASTDLTTAANRSMTAKDCDFVDKLQEQRDGQSGSGLVEHASVVADPDWHSEVLCDNLQEGDVFTSRSDLPVTGRTHFGSASGGEDRDSVPALLQASLQPEGTFSDRESDRQLDLSSLGDDSVAEGTSSQKKTAVVTSSQTKTAEVTSSRAKTAVVTSSRAKTAVVTINLRKRAVVTSSQTKRAVVTSSQTKTSVVTSSQTKRAVVTSSQTKRAVVTSSQTKRAVDGKERVSHKEQVKKQTGKVDDEEFQSKVETVVAGSRVSYHCRDCGKKFLAPAMMRYHLLQHRGSHPHPCSDCGAVFDQHHELNMHIRSSHPLLAKKLFPAAQGDGGEDEKPESLSEETSGFEAAEKPLNGAGANSGTEKLIEKNVEAAIVWVDGKRVYSCLNCGQRFSQRSRMKSHFQIHVNHRPHTCHECGVSFSRKYHLQRHTSTKHPPTGPAVEACKKEEEADANEEEEDNDDALPEKVKTEKDSPTTVNGSESFSCRECGQAFTKQCSLARHVRSHTNERRYSCKKCGSAFYRLSHLKMHVMRKHQSVRPFICTLCTASFTDAYHLHRHEVTHTKHQPYKCPECQLAFSNTRQLKNHLQSHLLAGVETDGPTRNTETRGRGNSLSFSEGKHSLTARCVELENADGLVDDASPSTMVDSSSSSVNVELQGTDRPRGGACLPLQWVVTPDTDASPSTELVPRDPTHERSIPETDAEWKAYAAVNSSANSKRKRNKPVKRVRKQPASASHGCDAALPSSSSPQQRAGPHAGEKPYLCKQCGQGFTKRHAVKRHELLHLGVKPFVCRECSRAFSRHSHLVKHCRQHTGERPYVCSVCGASFLEPSHLKRHNRKHTGEKPYMCEWCGASFIQSGELKTHIMAMHTDHRPFQCSQCPKAYTTSSLLRVHMRTHTGERPYVCSHCGAAFKIISHLKDHTLKHTGEKPKQCTLCPSAYTRTSHLKRHMLRAHPGWDPLIATQSVWTAKENEALIPSASLQSASGVSAT